MSQTGEGTRSRRFGHRDRLPGSHLGAWPEWLRRERVTKVIVELDERYLERFGATKTKVFHFMEETGLAPTIRSDEIHYDEVFIPMEG